MPAKLMIYINTSLYWQVHDMKIIQINTVCGQGSTGKICVGISRALNQHDIENYIIYSSGYSDYPQSVYCGECLLKLQALKSRIFGNYGFNSKKTTRRIIRILEDTKPDIVHLHNMHGHNCHLSMLMDYLREKHIKVIWTFHDCWAFTAYCPHFVMANCDQWKTECHQCARFRHYSWLLDRSRNVFQRKKLACSNLDLTIVTPSEWLASMVRQSFLKVYPVKVINNGIDTSVFQPVTSDFHKNHNIPNNKFVLLGVAYKWSHAKGLDVFINLANKLDSDKFQIVLVGTDDQVDKLLPDNIISIHRTQNQTELAEIYSATDLFINPTLEDTFPTVNMESLACGTPVLTYRTGGSPEILDETCGVIVNCYDEEALYNAILNIEATRSFTAETCRRRALDFTQEDRFQEYKGLYVNV